MMTVSMAWSATAKFNVVLACVTDSAASFVAKQCSRRAFGDSRVRWRRHGSALGHADDQQMNEGIFREATVQDHFAHCPAWRTQARSRDWLARRAALGDADAQEMPAYPL